MPVNIHVWFNLFPGRISITNKCAKKKDFSFISTETKQEVYYEVKNNNFSLNFAYKLMI